MSVLDTMSLGSLKPLTWARTYQHSIIIKLSSLLPRSFVPETALSLQPVMYRTHPLQLRFTSTLSSPKSFLLLMFSG
jgi:hypothetical protein